MKWQYFIFSKDVYRRLQGRFQNINPLYTAACYDNVNIVICSRFWSDKSWFEFYLYLIRNEEDDEEDDDEDEEENDEEEEEGEKKREEGEIKREEGEKEREEGEKERDEGEKEEG